MTSETATPSQPTFGLWYDFRNPAGVPFESFYDAALEQIEWAEGLGFETVWLTEHHFIADGYTPSPLVIAAAIGARTRSLRIGTNLMLLPLHNPVRLAEDAATLSLLTHGRFDLGVGLGYREIEFEAFGRSLRNRPSLAEEGADVIRRAWAGESIATGGKRFSFPDVCVTPTPATTPKLLVGGMVEPAIERAARIGDGFLSTLGIGHDIYAAGLEKAGKSPAEGAIYAGQWVIIDDDPEATWARIGDHAVYQLNEYIEWGAFGPPDQVPRFPDRDAIAANGPYQLWDPATAIERLTELLSGQPLIRDVHFWAQLPGEPVDSGSQRVELLAKKVVPEVRARLATSAPAP